MSEPKLVNYFNGDELAADVVRGKYLLDTEETPDDMHHREAKEFAKIEWNYRDKDLQKHEALSRYGTQLQKQLKKATPLDVIEHIYGLFKDFKYVVPQGSIMSSLGTEIIASLSNCWVAESPYDSYGGILKTDGDLAYYYKRRGGVGTDLSNLRPAGAPTKNTSKSSTGVASFMHRFSNTTREVAMNGRRGALMLSLSVDHPDILDFIKIKRDGTSVTGANISVRLNDRFMKAVQNDEDYILRWPCEMNSRSTELAVFNEALDAEYNKMYNVEGAFFKKIRAKELWDELIYSAKNHAEPGLMYWDNVMSYDPAAVYDQFKPTCSNPCGEQFLNPNDSCRLMVLNLFSFVENPFTEQAVIDFQKLYEYAYQFTKLGDNLVDLELEYIQRIIDKIKSDKEPEYIKRHELELWETSYEKTKAGRRIGLGITALGDMLAALGLKYDSDEALEIIEQVMAKKMEAELDCSIDLSILRGSFDGFDAELEANSESKFFKFLAQKFPSQMERMREFGRRNVSWSTIAPTGTVSLMTQTTSGCEPIFQPFYMRRKKINPNDVGVRVDFVDETGDSWQEFPVVHPKIYTWLEALGWDDVQNRLNEITKEELEIVLSKSPWYGSTANDIDWVKRNKIQSILQAYTTNAISSTINLPSTVTEEEVSEIYMSGWSMGLKGQTVYVDGSRSGVLVTESAANQPEEEFPQHDAPKRPKELEAAVHHITAQGKPFTVLVGLIDKKPYEVFIEEGRKFDKDSLGIIQKKSRGNYIFIQGEEKFNIIGNMTFDQQAITRLCSIALRHGADIKYLVSHGLNKNEGDITSFSKALARALKTYIKDGETLNGLSLPDCDQEDKSACNVVFEEGCEKCLTCGKAKCG